MSSMRIYDPTAPSSRQQARPAPRPGSLSGLRVGILDNSKANAGLLMGAIAEELKARHGARDVIVRRKPVNGPASAAILKDFQAGADVVLAGSAD